MTDRIVAYLELNGAMSGRDIVDDLDGCTEIDVQFAAMDGRIQSCDPVPGGWGAWYTL